jgi:hypothetical protein
VSAEAAAAEAATAAELLHIIWRSRWQRSHCECKQVQAQPGLAASGTRGKTRREETECFLDASSTTACRLPCLHMCACEACAQRLLQWIPYSARVSASEVSRLSIRGSGGDSV